MGLFSKKKEPEVTVSGIPGAHYVKHDVEAPLPVAVPVSAQAPTKSQASAPVYHHATATTPVVPPKVTSRLPMFLNPCPHCFNNSRTRVRTAPNWITWLAVVALAFLFWPLCWVPLVTDQLRHTEHFCLSCHKSVGKVQPMQDCCVKNR